MKTAYEALPAIPQSRRAFSSRKFGSDMLSKNWFEGAVPFVALFLLLAAIAVSGEDYFAWSNLSTLSRYFSDTALLVLAMLVVVAVGGIDLSVGSAYAVCVLTALYLFHIWELPVVLVVAGTVMTGALVGALNGLLCGILGCGALLSTLATMIVLRGVFVIASQATLVPISTSFRADDLWDFLGFDAFAGLPVSFWIAIIFALAIYLMFRHARFGWHVLAVGGNKKAARHGGVRLRRVIFLSYVLAGVLVGLAGFLYAARENSAGSDTGIGLEFVILTGLVIGLGGFTPGRGNVLGALVGMAVIFLLSNFLLNIGFRGDFTQLVTGAILVIVLAADAGFRRNRHRLLASSYLNPASLEFSPPHKPELFDPASREPVLAKAELLASGQIDGPEDVILDRDDNLYCGTRDGRIVRLSPPHYDKAETYAKTGGRPLGLAFDAEERLVVCIAGMGLYRIAGPGKVERLTSQTRRSWGIEDDRVIKMADDLDIAPDGRIFFTDATKRYEMESWAVDLLEGRPNGRLLCYDPSNERTTTVCDNLHFPNGVCVSHDGKLLLVASTGLCSIMAFDLARPTAPPRIFMDGLPGYPDNINRASDGGYWIAIAGMRSPALNLAMQDSGFRRRMAKRVAPTHWLFGNLNMGGVVKCSADGQIEDVYWDAPAGPLYMITSMREHKGQLFLGGVINDKIGRLELAGANRDWTTLDSYWGKTGPRVRGK